MQIKSWQLVILAIIIFLFDFFTLGNRNVIDNPLTDKIALAIALLCLPVFLIGIIKTIYDYFPRTSEQEKIKREEGVKQGIRTTGVEAGFRKLLAILLLISVVPLLIFPFFIILGIPNILLGLYLLSNRRYHLIIDAFLVLLGLTGYFLTFFLTGLGNFYLYKNIELSICPGFISFAELLVTGGIWGLIKYFFLSSALFLFGGDLIAKLKLYHRQRLNVILFLVVFLVIFFLPFLYSPRVALGEGTSGGTGGGVGPLQHFSAWNTQFHMSFDQALNSYIYTAQMPNQDTNNSAFIDNICVDSKLIPITKENGMLQVDNGVVANGKITVAAGETATIKLVSQKPFYVVSLLEGEFHYVSGFLK